MEYNGSKNIELNNASYQMEDILELQSDHESQNGGRKVRILSKMANINESSTFRGQEIVFNKKINDIGQSSSSISGDDDKKALNYKRLVRK
jgi:hypothetical protein